MIALSTIIRSNRIKVLLQGARRLARQVTQA
jgi:hypothetical protein